MAQLTEHMRSVAYDMFSDGADSKTVARRIRRTPGSVAALKANWTRSQVSKTRNRRRTTAR